MANPSVDDLRIQVLRVAGDNDGLWEFAKILSPELKSREAFGHLRTVFVELINEGLITVADDDARLSSEKAKAYWAYRRTGRCRGSRAVLGTSKAMRTACR